jgi:uncharacterized protein (DUF305 family)
VFEKEIHGMKSITVIMCLAAVSLLAAASAQNGNYAGFVHAMHESMGRMNKDMDAASMTGNPDRDFASMMIPHHQGAIDMAKVELSYGKDPVMRRLAQGILVEQQSEIEAMRLWLHKTAPENSTKEK